MSLMSNQGDEVGGTENRNRRTKALMQGLGTRRECRHRVFVRTEKTFNAGHCVLSVRKSVKSNYTLILYFTYMRIQEKLVSTFLARI